MVTFGKRGWMGSWMVTQEGTVARTGSIVPRDPASLPAPLLQLQRRLVTRLRGPETESSKCYI